MRVLFVIAHLDKGGGQAVQCRQLIQHLRPHLESAELIALSAATPSTFGPQSDGSLVVGPLSLPSGIITLRDAIRDRSRDFDIVHALDIYYGLPAARLARAHPLVVRLGSHPVEDLASRWGIWGRTWMDLVTPWLFQGTEVVVNSPHLITTVPTGHVQCIPNGVDVARFALGASREQVRRGLGLPLDVPIVTFTGKVVPRKNIEDILWLLTRRGDLHFLLVGALTEPYYGDRYYRRLRTEFTSVMDRVHAIGEVSIEELPRYLAATDVFVFPSRLEGMPNSILEAMAAGVPVVASDNPAHARLVADGGGMVYRSREELLAAVDHWVADPTDRRRAGERARAFVTQRYSFDAAVRAYLDVYSAAVG